MHITRCSVSGFKSAENACSNGGSPRVAHCVSSGGQEPKGSDPVANEQSKAARSKELANWFGIPETETLVDDFHCAMRKRVLLQGRLFVFDHYVCFHSNLFGYVNKKIIALADIVSVIKKTHFRFPNSIEIVDCHGQREFFTSFLARDSAFKAIVTSWGHVGPEQAEQAVAQLDDESPGRKSASIQVVSMLTGYSVLWGGNAWRKKPARSSGDADEGQDSHDQNLHSGCIGSDGGAPGGECEVATPLQRGLTLCNMDAKADDECRDEECSETAWNTISAEPNPPPRCKDSKLLLSTQLPGTLRDFFDLVIADESPFLEDVLVELGNRKIDIAAWKATEQLGHIRDVQYIAPIKGAFSSWGVPTTRCFSTHRFCRYPNNHLVFETQQTNLDIPYGETFTVDMRWDVRRDPNSCDEEPRVLVDIHVRTPFSRTCLFKKIIESGVYQQAKDNYTYILAQANVELQRRLAARIRAPASATALQPQLSHANSRPLIISGLDPTLIGPASCADAVGVTGEVVGTPTPPSRAFMNHAASGSGLAPLAFGAASIADATGGTPGAASGIASWVTSVRVGLLLLLLVLMCVVQLYMLLLLQPGVGGTSSFPSWLRGMAGHAQQGMSVGSGGAPILPVTPLQAPAMVTAAASAQQQQQQQHLQLSLEDMQNPAALLQRLLQMQQAIVALQAKADAAASEVSCFMQALTACAASSTPSEPSTST